MISSLSQLEERLTASAQKSKVALAAGEDIFALRALIQASEKQWVTPLIVGNADEINKLCDDNGLSLSGIEVVPESNQLRAVEKAVKMVSQDDADILMKGASSTAVLLKAVLNKDWGLRKGELLSHLAIVELKKYHKLLGISDVAINIAPGADEKIEITKNAVEILNRIGIHTPKVALIAAVEKVYPSMQATVDAEIVMQYFERLPLEERNCFVAGPLAMDNAVDKESALHKGIDSPVAGDADLLIMPQIETGNVLYKSLSIFSGARIASVVLGARKPIVLTSRADSDDTKENSIMLAAVIQQNQ